MTKHQRFQKIYTNNFKVTRHVLKKFPLTDRDVEDLQHDVFMNFYKHMDQIPENQERAFLIVAARNAGIDFLRKKKRHKTDLDTFEVHEPAKTMWESDPEREIQLQVIGQLLKEVEKEPGGESFCLYYREGLTLKEIAERLQEPTGTIAARVARMREKFKQRMQRKLEPYL
jgi:RNA polymerase sigma-70 factor (ECF subfamily)